MFAFAKLRMFETWLGVVVRRHLAFLKKQGMKLWFCTLIDLACPKKSPLNGSEMDKHCQRSSEFVTRPKTFYVFWDCIFLISHKEHNTSVSGAHYTALRHKLRQHIRDKRRGKLTKGMRFVAHSKNHLRCNS